MTPLTNRHRRTAKASAVVALALLGTAAGGAVALAEDGTRSGAVRPTVIGNPAVGSYTAPAPVGTLGFTLPPTLPKGATPDTHVYVTASASVTEYFAASEFSLPAGLSIDALSLTVHDDANPGENVAAETAPLYACFMPSTVYASSPNETVNYDCTLPSKGVRKAGADGGTWTFDVAPLASTVSSKGRFGLAIVGDPTGTTAYSVSFVRKSFSLRYSGRTADGSQPTTDLPAVSPPGGGASQPAQAPAGSTSTVVGSPVLPQIGQGSSVSAPQVPAVSVQGDVPQDTGRQRTIGAVKVASTTASRKWRPLLLLLVPLIPFAALALNRRLGEDQDSDALAAQFPGLASLRA